ncbi:MAG TPA: PEP-CTERM sorting domain-containing protein [Pirellulales bacterium]|nr:PEP-CTERM sorting domain-containing protein [Pirellulales bacterium]
MKLHHAIAVAAGLLAFAFVADRASASTIVADWTLSNDATGYSGGSTASGMPLDSVGGHNFETPYSGANPAPGGPLGGPSSTSSDWSATGGFYGTQSGATTLPNDNFSVEVHAALTSYAQGILFSSDGGRGGDLQIGEDASGDWVAYFSYDGNNFTSGTSGGYSGVLIGSAPVALDTDYDLKVDDIGGVFSFFVNGVEAGTGVTPTGTFGGFNAIHLAVAPGGGGPNYDGLASDLTITSGVTAVPEPASLALFGLGAIGLLAVVRRRRGVSSHA